MTTIELVGLELHGYHGVNEDERRDGQRFVFDVWLEMPDGTGASDRIEDTVDYREVAALVRVSKPQVKLDPPVEHSAVTVERRR